MPCPGCYLSRDSWLGQRNDGTLPVQVVDCLVNGSIEFGKVSIRVWFKIVRIWVTQTRGNHRPAGVGF